ARLLGGRLLVKGRALDLVPVPEARVPARRDAAPARIPADWPRGRGQGAAVRIHGVRAGAARVGARRTVAPARAGGLARRPAGLRRRGLLGGRAAARGGGRVTVALATLRTAFLEAWSNRRGFWFQ